MYELTFSKRFKERYQAFIKKAPLLEKRIDKALRLLKTDPKHPSLKSHKANTPDFGVRWSSNVTVDIRIIWDYDQDNMLVILLLTIGGHSGKSRVYK